MDNWRGAEASAKLARILTEAARIGRADPDRPAYEVLYETLEISETENSVALRRMTRLWSHPLAIRRDLLHRSETLDSGPGTTLTRIEGHFAKGVQGTDWDSWRRSLGQNAVADLRTIGRTLDPTGRVLSASVPLDTIYNFRERLTHCLTDVMSLNIPADLLEYFEDSLVSLIDAVDDYRVSGLTGIDQATTQAISAYPSAANELSSRSVRIRDALVSITAAAALVGVVTQDAQDISDLIQKLPWSQSQEQVSVQGDEKCTVIEIGSGTAKQKLVVDFTAEEGK
ncbi:hypothetical protein [Streptomyces sp. NPDC058674]|uniref:hypothetical protein n=1 Tax=Streptomyces sp. NPDC058674 TaxID=3346592 RepID=UPI003656B66C